MFAIANQRQGDFATETAARLRDMRRDCETCGETRETCRARLTSLWEFVSWLHYSGDFHRSVNLVISSVVALSQMGAANAVLQVFELRLQAEVVFG